MISVEKMQPRTTLTKQSFEEAFSDAMGIATNLSPSFSPYHNDSSSRSCTQYTHQFLCENLEIRVVLSHDCNEIQVSRNVSEEIQELLKTLSASSLGPIPYRIQIQLSDEEYSTTSKDAYPFFATGFYRRELKFISYGHIWVEVQFNEHLLGTREEINFVTDIHIPTNSFDTMTTLSQQVCAKLMAIDMDVFLTGYKDADDENDDPHFCHPLYEVDAIISSCWILGRVFVFSNVPPPHNSEN
jgi:hypothetical protein